MNHTQPAKALGKLAEVQRATLKTMEEVKTINGPMRQDGTPMFSKSLRQQWNEACLQIGIPSLTLNTCAKIMAILLHYGNNEAMVLSPHFRADCEYVQKRYHIEGGESPDPDFIEEFQPIEKELRNLEKPPQWAKDLMKNMYNIEIY